MDKKWKIALIIMSLVFFLGMSNASAENVRGQCSSTFHSHEDLLFYSDCTTGYVYALKRNDANWYYFFRVNKFSAKRVNPKEKNSSGPEAQEDN